MPERASDSHHDDRSRGPTPDDGGDARAEHLRRFDEALAFAVRQHAGQLRKGTRVPYVTHPIAVAETLAYHYPDRADLQLAGLLHDVLEDGEDAHPDDLARRFGESVAQLVQAVTKKPDAELVSLGLLEAECRDVAASPCRERRWRAQREGMLAELVPVRDGHESVVSERLRDVLRLKAADALANLRAVRRDLEGGVDVWTRFKAGRDASLWYYGAVVDRVGLGLPGERIAVALRRAFDAVAALPPFPPRPRFEADGA